MLFSFYLYLSNSFLCQSRQHLQSTTIKQASPSTYLDNIKKNIKLLKKSPDFDNKNTLHDNLLDLLNADFSPSSNIPNEKTNNILYLIFDSSSKEISYIDLTDRFPYKSACGNQYILVAYHYDANAILARAIKIERQQLLLKVGKILTNNSLTQVSNTYMCY